MTLLTRLFLSTSHGVILIGNDGHWVLFPVAVVNAGVDWLGSRQLVIHNPLLTHVAHVHRKLVLRQKLGLIEVLLRLRLRVAIRYEVLLKCVRPRL